MRHERYHGVVLTTDGEQLALEVMRHHRLIEAFLAETLGMPWDRVHDEAEVLEHYISEDLERRIAASLGNPSSTRTATRSPRAELSVAEDRPFPLAELDPGQLAVFARVSDSEPEMLRHLAGRGIRPGARIEVLGAQPFGGPLGSRSVESSTRSGRARAQDAGRGRRGQALNRPVEDRRRRRRRGDGRPERHPNGVEDVLPGEAAVARAARRSLDGQSRGLRRIWPFLGPAFIAAVAYIDPGNFATNIAGGAKFGYLLLWVVLAANLIAMVVQTQSAKLGIATGKNLPELCRETFSRPDLDRPLDPGRDRRHVHRRRRGRRRRPRTEPAVRHPALPGRPDRRSRGIRDPGLQQRASAGSRRRSRHLSGSCSSRFAFEIINANPDGGEVAKHLFEPGFSGTESILLTTGIIGATVMPHVIYLHSALTSGGSSAATATSGGASSASRRSTSSSR